MLRLFVQAVKKLVNRAQQHYYGPLYLRELQKVQAESAKEICMYREELFKMEQELTKLRTTLPLEIQEVLRNWTAEVLCDRQYWLDLFRKVLQQPLGQDVWRQACYEAIDRLNDQQKAEFILRICNIKVGKA